MMNLKYTVVFLFNKTHDKVLLMRKEKGPYINCLNGVGGKFQSEETPHQCAIRETKEETGVDIEPIHLVKCIYPSGCELHVFYAVVADDAPEQMEEEPFLRYSVQDVINNQNIDLPFAGEGDTQIFIHAAGAALKEQDI